MTMQRTYRFTVLYDEEFVKAPDDLVLDAMKRIRLETLRNVVYIEREPDEFLHADVEDFATATEITPP